MLTVQCVQKCSHELEQQKAEDPFPITPAICVSVTTYLSEFPSQTNVVDASDVTAKVGRKVNGQVVDIVESGHPVQHHQWKK